jgi:hypothetical protein
MMTRRREGDDEDEIEDEEDERDQKIPYLTLHVGIVTLRIGTLDIGLRVRKERGQCQARKVQMHA